MNFSGGSAALVATFKITIEHCLHVYHNLSNHHKTLHCLHLYHRIGHFNALALLRVARNPSSVGCPTPNTGNPFTWIRNKRVQLKIHKVLSNPSTIQQIPFKAIKSTPVHQKFTKFVKSIGSQIRQFSQIHENLSKVGRSVQLLNLFWQEMHPCNNKYCSKYCQHTSLNWSQRNLLFDSFHP